MARVKYYDQASQEWKYADAALNMKGRDGYTPQKGIDYFTEEDVQELTENVIDQGVLTYNEQNLTEEQKAQARQNIGIDRISMDKLTENLDANGFRITNLPLPESGSEPATKEFVENFTIEGSTYVATDDGEGNVVIRPYLADEDELVFKSHIQNRENPHSVTAEQVGAVATDDLAGIETDMVMTAKAAILPEAKTYTNEQVKKAAPRNLLDNSDFRNPVNQRGQTTYSGDGYTIDRWFLWSSDKTATLTLGSNGATINTNVATSFSQRFPKGHFKGDKYTFVVCLADGTKTINNNPIKTDNPAFDRIEISSATSVSIKYVALYEGEYSLDTIPEYQLKGYSAELLECQRYFVRYGNINQNNHIGWAMAATNTIANAVLVLAQPMRIQTPTITIQGSFVLRHGITDIPVTSVSPNSFGSGAFGYMAINAEGMTIGQMYAVRLVLGTLDVSADL